LIVTTYKSMIESRNDIEEPFFSDFIRQLYDDSSASKRLGRVEEPC
jgi:hypothetical protein